MTKPSDIWVQNFALAMSVMAEIEDDVRAHGLEMKEFFLLDKMEQHPSPAALARALLMPKPSVTFMVKRLEAAGFVKRQPVPDDLRRFHLTLTAPGRKALEAARGFLDDAFGKRLARLTATQRAELGRLLEKISS